LSGGPKVMAATPVRSRKPCVAVPFVRRTSERLPHPFPSRHGWGSLEASFDRATSQRIPSAPVACGIRRLVVNSRGPRLRSPSAESRLNRRLRVQKGFMDCGLGRLGSMHHYCWQTCRVGGQSMVWFFPIPQKEQCACGRGRDSMTTATIGRRAAARNFRKKPRELWLGPC
jgi:hypothetical protein